MPFKDRPGEFMRIRPRKGGDKDRDGDTQSVSASVTTIRERKHRKSFMKEGSSTETSTQASKTCQGDGIDQLSPFPETEESESASASTSPIARTSSNVAHATKPGSTPSVETPANLQPYLEELEDSRSAIIAPNRIAESEEWIGPREDATQRGGEPDDCLTPTPRSKLDPLESISLQRTDSEQASRQASPQMKDPEREEARKSFLDNNKIYSWAAGDNYPEQYYYPSQMSNPFLPSGANAQIAPSQPPATADRGQKHGRVVTPPTLAPIPATVPPPVPVSIPPPNLVTTSERRDARPRSAVEPSRRETYKEYPPPAVIEQTHFYPPSPPSPETGMAPGLLVPVPPAMPPMPVHHAPPSPLPYPSVPARFDHPSNILHRVGNVIPDIAALMDMYHGTCSVVHAREQYISDLEAQRATEAERLNKRIDSLTKDIRSMIRHHEAQERKLQGEIDHWEKKYKKAQENCSSELRQKEEVRSIHENSKKKHRDTLQSMSQAFSQDKECMIAIHSGEKQTLLDQLAEAAQQAEETVASLKQKHATERQVQDFTWEKHTQSIQETHANVRSELEHTINAQITILAEERKKYDEMKHQWNQDREDLARQWEEEKESRKQKVECDRRALLEDHRKELVEVQRSMDSAQAKQKADAEGRITKYKEAKDEVQGRLEETLAFHKSEILLASESFRREKDEYSKAMEEQQAELQARVREAQQEKQITAHSRDESQSRQLREAQFIISQLQKENEELLRSRGPSQSRQANESKDTIVKLQKENDSLRSERLRLTKSKTDEPISSRSSTPMPKDEGLERSRSHRVSGIFATSGSSKSRSAAHEAGNSSRGEGHRGHHRDRTS